MIEAPWTNHAWRNLRTTTAMHVGDCSTRSNSGGKTSASNARPRSSPVRACMPPPAATPTGRGTIITRLAIAAAYARARTPPPRHTHPSRARCGRPARPGPARREPVYTVSYVSSQLGAGPVALRPGPHP